MAEWDTETEKYWRSWLGAAGGIGTAADHDPLDIISSWQGFDSAAEKLRQYLESTGVSLADAVADPDTHTRLQAMATAMWGLVGEGEVAWALRALLASVDSGTAGQSHR